MINTLKRHSWFFAAAGISSWIAAGVPLFVRIFDQAEQPSYATPGWLEVIALAAFGLALAAAILDNQGSTFKRWLLLGVQSAAIMIMGLHSAGTMIFPLLVLVAWQATLMMSFHGALAWTVLQTLVLWAVLLPTWNSLACRVTLGIFLAFQFFGVFAARLTRDEASHAREHQCDSGRESIRLPPLVACWQGIRSRNRTTIPHRCAQDAPFTRNLRGCNRVVTLSL